MCCKLVYTRLTTTAGDAPQRLTFAGTGRISLDGPAAGDGPDCQNGSLERKDTMLARQMPKLSQPLPCRVTRVSRDRRRVGKAETLLRTNRDKMRHRAVSPRKSGLRKRPSATGCRAKAGQKNRKKRGNCRRSAVFQNYGSSIRSDECRRAKVANLPTRKSLS